MLNYGQFVDILYIFEKCWLLFYKENNNLLEWSEYDHSKLLVKKDFSG